MLAKLSAIWKLFKAGEAVANPKLWKTHQVSITMLGGLIIAAVQLAKTFGYELPIDENTAQVIAGGVLAVVNVIFTITTSKHIGIAPTGALPEGDRGEAQQAMPSAPEASGQAAEPLPSVSGDASPSRFDQSTVERASEWVERHRTAEADPFKAGD